MALVLVVDDDKAIRAAVRDVLELEGYEVSEAEDGNRALQVVRSQPPDLILCDIFMPMKDGFETIRELRRQFPDIPVVAVSGGSGVGMDVLRLARHLGAAAVLEKPLRRAQMLAAIRGLLPGAPTT
jgi:CheY-like chemotaxis protein